MKRLALASVLIAGFLASCWPTHAANIYTVPRMWGGSYVFIVGEIISGDEITFARLNPPKPVYVRPIGPGGYVPTALAIADAIAGRGYNTIVQNNDGGCASACTIIWLSGRQVIVQNSGILRFHSRASNGEDDLDCNAMVAKHLQSYGYTAFQAWQLSNAAPHEITRLGTKAWAASLGFRWQVVFSFPGWANACDAKFCMGVP
jgi:hypothetical protein